MYSYPPLRVQAPLIIPLLIWLRWRYLGIKRTALAAFCAAGLILSAPLIVRTFSGEIQGRYGVLSIFSSEFLKRAGAHSPFSILGIFLDNMWAHLTPAFLLISGDENLRHNSRFCGMLGWLDVLALGAGLAFLIALWRTSRRCPKLKSNTPVLPVLLVCLWGFLAGIVPAALTWEALPHALRAIGAWPFLSLFCGIVLWCAVSRWRALVTVSFLAGVVFAACYGVDYFTRFPVAAADSFDAKIVELAGQAQRTGSWAEFDSLKAVYPAMALWYYEAAAQEKTGAAKR
jgi:hypothetical protein